LARAPGRTWAGRVNVRAGESKTVLIPSLQESPAGAATTSGQVSRAPADGSSSDSARLRRTVGFVVGGAGLVAVGIGTAFGVSAFGQERDARDLCHSDTTCSNPDGIDASDAAGRSAKIADITIATGLVALGVGIVLVA